MKGETPSPKEIQRPPKRGTMITTDKIMMRSFRDLTDEEKKQIAQEFFTKEQLKKIVYSNNPKIESDDEVLNQVIDLLSKKSDLWFDISDGENYRKFIQRCVELYTSKKSE